MAKSFNEGLRNALMILQGTNKSRQENFKNQLETVSTVQKMRSLGAPAPEGYDRDPYSGKLVRSLGSGNAQVPGLKVLGGKVVQDPSFVDPLEQSKIDYYKSRTGTGPTLTPGRQMAKDKATTDIFSTVELNKPKRKALKSAKEGLSKIPQGRIGKISLDYFKNFDPQNPLLTDWQNLKSVLTDAQLMNTAKTKGAISDQEMRLFAQAAANDDLVSIARMSPTLNRLGEYMDAEESGMFGAYQKNYGEDPRTWFQEDGGGNQVPGFDYAKAKADGWSDSEIQAFLANKNRAVA